MHLLNCTLFLLFCSSELHPYLIWPLHTPKYSTLFLTVGGPMICRTQNATFILHRTFKGVGLSWLHFSKLLMPNFKTSAHCSEWPLEFALLNPSCAICLVRFMLRWA